MKKHLISILSALILLFGVMLMLYPIISDYWNSLHQSRAIAGYAGQIQTINDERYQQIWQEAEAYNHTLLYKGGARVLGEQEMIQYHSLLNPGENGIMGSLEIPLIKVSLPIYHGTDETVLQIAVGHVEWSSLPVGGQSSHCVLSGHRGLPSARLFTDLDQLSLGDQFILKIMNEKLVYEVDQIVVTNPEQTEELVIEEGEDFCTLVTCTPYGINSHRLLVRGKRVTIQEQAEILTISADAEVMKLPVRFLFVVFVLFAGMMLFAYQSLVKMKP